MTSDSFASSNPSASNEARQAPFWLLALLILGFVTPHIPVNSQIAALVGAVVLTSVYVFFALRFIFALSQTQRPKLQVLALCIGCIMLWSISEFGVKPYLQTRFRSFGADIPTNWQWLGLLNFNLRPLLLMSAAASGGVALSAIVRHANMVGPLCGVAALIDIWGVLFGGIVSQVLAAKNTAPIAEKALAAMPKIAASANSKYSVEIASIGAGDWLFLGLFFGVLHAHQMNARGALNWVTPLVIMALLLIASGLIPFLPGLFFIGLGVAIPNWKYFVFTRDERFALLWAGLFVLILTGALYLAITSQLTK